MSNFSLSLQTLAAKVDAVPTERPLELLLFLALTLMLLLAVFLITVIIRQSKELKVLKRKPALLTDEELERTIVDALPTSYVGKSGKSYKMGLGEFRERTLTKAISHEITQLLAYKNYLAIGEQ